MHFISTSTYDLKSTMIPEFACKAVDETTKALWLQKVYLRLVMDRVPKTRVSVLGFGSVVEKWVKRQVEQGFHSFFCQIFAIFEDIRNFYLGGRTLQLKIFKNCQNLKFSPLSCKIFGGQLIS